MGPGVLGVWGLVRLTIERHSKNRFRLTFLGIRSMSGPYAFPELESLTIWRLIKMICSILYLGEEKRRLSAPGPTWWPYVKILFCPGACEMHLGRCFDACLMHAFSGTSQTKRISRC